MDNAQKQSREEQGGGGLLSVVATPIGNLGDMSLRAIDVLKAADTVLCEDTRISGKLLSHYGIATPMQTYHEHNAEAKRPRILSWLAEGKHLALISDAGTPLISDPGYKLVRDVVAAGCRVDPIPGACAAIAALSAAGLPSDCFSFHGFLPPKGAARKASLQQLAAACGTLILYETGPKIANTLRDLQPLLGPRTAVLMREITKRFEEHLHGTLAELAARLTTPPKGELVLLIAPAEEAAATAEEYDALLRGALSHVSVKEAAAIVASQTGIGRSALYQRALQLHAEHD